MIILYTNQVIIFFSILFVLSSSAYRAVRGRRQLEGVQMKAIKKMIMDVEQGEVERIRLFSLGEEKTKRRHDDIFKLCKSLL